jgi:hypothetical protein
MDRQGPDVFAQDTRKCVRMGEQDNGRFGLQGGEMIVANPYDEDWDRHRIAGCAHVHAGQRHTDGATAGTGALHPIDNVSFGIGRVSAIIVHHFCLSHI